ncbi:MAG: hypothetical protein KC964_08170 [Candidatus Omnitrophica bacterium]|nr:hypothetical protein [Candidatus Omnitrophota bacterium]
MCSCTNRIEYSLRNLCLGFILLATAASTRADANSELAIHVPTIAHPYYHFVLDIPIDHPSQVNVEKLSANGQNIRSFVLEDKTDLPNPDQPNRKKRLAIYEAVISNRPEKTYESPQLVGRLDWQAGKTYSIEADLLIGGKEGKQIQLKAEAKAPSKGGYWNPDWKHYQSVVLTETAGIDRESEPVHVTLILYPDQVSDPDKEFRVVRYDTESRSQQEIRRQVLDYSVVDREEPPMYNEKGELKPKTFLPSSSVTLAFPADVPAKGSSIYLVFYGNPNAPLPDRASDLVVNGTRPGVIVENEYYRLKLHDLSGMLDEVALKSKPDLTFVHKKETNGAIQWNPGCYAPPRAWAHLSDWEPGKYDYEYEETVGPVEYQTHRWGQMPLMPELNCSMDYEFNSGVPYFKMRSSVHVKYDTPVQALRNGEVVFARESFSEAAWYDPITHQIETREITAEPDLTEWMVPNNTPWLAFFDREKGVGYAGIQLNSMNVGLEGRMRDYNPYLYITTGPWVYWTRALLYPYGSRNPQQMIEVPAETIFLEEWAYLPFELSSNSDDEFEAVKHWTKVVNSPLIIQVVDPTDDRMQVPEEIYLEPEKTGWE